MIRTVTFGQYPQVDDKVSPLEWYVIKNYDDGAMCLLSKYAIDFRPFDDWCDATSWKKSTIRKWLQEKFYFMAFSREEREKIRSTTVISWDDILRGSEDIEDRVSLLSSMDLRMSEMPDFYMQCKPTPFAKAKHDQIYADSLKESLRDEACEWWVLDYGKHKDDVALALADGTISMDGCSCGFPMYVRPSICVELLEEKREEPAPQEMDLFTGGWGDA